MSARVALVFALAAALGCAPSGTGSARPPILFVSIDTLAARHLALHGYERDTAPNLTAFAAEAIVVERAQANSPWTVPSYLSQLTGLYPSAHALEDGEPAAARPAWERHRLAPDRETLAGRLARGGYRTAGFFENPWLGVDAFGFARGFEVWRGPDELPRAGLAGRLGAASAWLAELPSGTPWFLFLQSTEPHAPYTPPEPFGGAFAPGAPDPRPVASADGHAFGAIPRAVARGVRPDGPLPDTLDAAQLQAAYDAEILAMDAAFGALVDALRRRGVLEDAIVVFSADHGESMVAHDFLFGHGVLYEENLHVPLVVRLPGGAGGGRRVRVAAQLTDLVPTLLELAGVGAPAGLHGRSLAPALRGAETADMPLFAEGGVQQQEALVLDGFKLVESRPWTAPASALGSHPALGALPREQRDAVAAAAPDARPALVLEALGGPRRELYDLASDPAELADLSADPRHAERLARMSAALAAERARAELARSAAERDGVGASAAPDADTQAELERLGYAGDGGH